MDKAISDEEIYRLEAEIDILNEEDINFLSSYICVPLIDKVIKRKNNEQLDVRKIYTSKSTLDKFNEYDKKILKNIK